MNKANDIVVVDDNPALLRVLSDIFEAHGHTVRTASDGFAALTMMRERMPDVLLSDLNMPGMSGFELLSIVRRRFPAIAVIAMSGAYSGGSVPAGVAADGFYAKGSCSIAELFEILSTIEDEAAHQSMRATTPIWVPGLPSTQDDSSSLTVACPECLRSFSPSLRQEAFDRYECCCPHCFCPVPVAIVRHLDKTDITGHPSSAAPARAQTPAFAHHSNSARYSESVTR
jgi:CheY-like chemotaxis protein